MRKLLLLLLGLILAQAGWAQLPTYRLDKMMGTPVYSPRDVALDSRGNLYLADYGVDKLDSTGRFVANYQMSATPGITPTALTIDAADNLYVAGFGAAAPNNVVRKYGPSGQVLLQFGTSGYGTGQVANVAGMCVGPQGNIYLADDYTSRLFGFNSQGTLLFERAIPNPSGVNVKDVAVDAAGNVYVLQQNFVITKLTAAGQLVGTITLAGAPTGNGYYLPAEVMVLDPAGNFTVSVSQGGIDRYSPTGAALGAAIVLSQSGVGYGITSSTHTALAYDPTGNLYATTFTHQAFENHLFKFSPAGTLRKRWGNLESLSHVRQDEAGNVYTWNGTSVRKYDATGQLVLTFAGGSSSLPAMGMALDGAGNIYLLSTASYSSTSSVVQKLSPQGQLLNTFTYFGVGPGYVQQLTGLAVDAGGYMYVSEATGGCVRKLNPQGVFVQTIGVPGLGAGQLQAPRAVAVDLAGNVYVADNNGRRVQRFGPSGQVQQQYGTAPTNTSTAVGDVDLEVDGRGRVYVASNLFGGSKIYAADASSAADQPGGGSRVSVNRRGTRLLLMSASNDLIRFYVSTTQPPENLLSGQIFHDPNLNCLKDATEQPLAGVAVVAQPGNYYGMSDENGRFTIATDTGTYTVQQLPPVYGLGRTLTQSCAARPTVTFRGYNNSATGVDFGNQVTNTAAPLLRVSVGANRRRRCFRNVTTVTYTNQGLAAAPNATVTVALPPQVIFLSANWPHTRNAAGQYVFQVGTVQPNQYGSIIIQDSVMCGDPTIRGLTVCTKAWMTPANTYTPPTAWNQASVAVQGRALASNQARFVLRNVGSGNMTDSTTFRLYQDTDLALQHRYKLAAGDSLVLRVPATRPVVRLEADQPAGHPIQRLATASVELRALGTPGQPNAAMVAMAPNVPAPEMAEDCQPILDSYDPNDKGVMPVGVTSQHYTPTGAPLHFKVRFQNTGSADAYLVEVVDTLAASLDLRTLRVEAASHPYRLRIGGKGRPVLTFTFAGIGLPPSSQNEPGSNGFVQFSIEPLAGLPAKALVENYADIFFDYNPPVRTNTTTNRIYDVPVAPVPAVALSYPAVVASPAVSALAPGQGRIGTLVTISGQRFGATAAANQVLFNGVAAPVLSASPTSLTVRVPAATTGSVQVITADGAARSPQPFTVYQAPILAAMAPAEGVVGTVITLTGSYFSPLAAQDTVWVGGVPALVQQATATTLQVVVPAGAATGKIKLSTLGGTVESAQAFVVWYPPTVLSFSPARGKAGTLLTLTGTNYAPAARNTVLVGGQAAAVVQATATSLQVRVPAGAQTGKVQVQTPGGSASSAADFTFLPAPVITSFAPAQGSVGETVVLTGQHFLLDGLPDTIYMGGVRALVLAATPTSATIQVPKGAQTNPIAAHGLGGRGLSTTPFTVLDLSPAEAITLYPNPAHEAVTLDWLRADFTLEQVQVYNALGALVATADLSQQAASSLTLPLRAGQNGLFLLVIQTSRGPVLKRLAVY